MSKEQIAIELVKAWCVQTAGDIEGSFSFSELIDNYKEALKRLNEEDPTGKDLKIQQLEETLRTVYDSLSKLYTNLELKPIDKRFEFELMNEKIRDIQDVIDKEIFKK